MAESTVTLAVGEQRLLAAIIASVDAGTVSARTADARRLLPDWTGAVFHTRLGTLLALEMVRESQRTDQPSVYVTQAGWATWHRYCP